MSYEELSVAQTQARAAKAEGLQKHHKWNIANLDERILVFLFLLIVLGVSLAWATVSSELIRYGSVGMAVLVVVLWFVARVRNINKIRKERELQVKAMQAKSS